MILMILISGNDHEVSDHKDDNDVHNDDNKLIKY